MKFIKIGLVGICLVALAGCSQKLSEKTVRTTWEYKTVEMENGAAEQQQYIFSKQPLDYSTLVFEKKTVSSFNLSKNWDLLAKLGDDGWELQSATPLLQTDYPDPSHPDRAYVRTEKVLLLFKRLK